MWGVRRKRGAIVRGATSKPENELHRRWVGVMVTTSEHEWIKRRAAPGTVSGYLRKLLKIPQTKVVDEVKI